jgi:hypothetical protein
MKKSKGHVENNFMAQASESIPGDGGQDLVVFMVRKDTRCAECGQELWRGSLLRVVGDKGLCLACADLDHLEFLPAGDAAVTRRAGRYSKLKAVVLQWARARKRYERQGILVEAAAIERAEQEALADAEVRARRQARAAQRRESEDRQYHEAFAGAIRAHFPGCPQGEAQAIAGHACRKYSGRIGRTAAAKILDAQAVRLAVIAHIRHEHTNYDELLCRHGDRDGARRQVSERVAEVLRRWQEAPVG